MSNTLAQLSFSTVFKVGMFFIPGILMHTLFQRGLKINLDLTPYSWYPEYLRPSLKAKEEGREMPIKRVSCPTVPGFDLLSFLLFGFPRVPHPAAPLLPLQRILGNRETTDSFSCHSWAEIQEELRAKVGPGHHAKMLLMFSISRNEIRGGRKEVFPTTHFYSLKPFSSFIAVH